VSDVKAPIAASSLGVGVAQLDDGRQVACVFQTQADRDDTVIRVGYTKSQVDKVIAALTQCKERLPD
jgi:hypothetical protein